MGNGHRCVALLPSPLYLYYVGKHALADWRQNKLTSSEYDETTWSARTWLSFVSQRLSVATQLAAAQEVAEALGLSVAADPRLQ